MRTLLLSVVLALLLPVPKLLSQAAESSEAVAIRQQLQQNMVTLSARVEELEASNQSLREKVANLQREMQQVREEARKLGDRSAIQDQIHKLADSVKEVDAKRRADNEKVLGELAKLGKQIADTPVAPPPTRAVPVSNPRGDSPSAGTEKPTRGVGDKGVERGIEYVIKPGDSLSAIVQACRAKDIKLTQRALKEANPDISNWELLRPGKKIFIPVPNAQ
ncbi:MAG: LysM peptidoglycan-binding domain-containing protein [Verrucomicrobia bacterium]|nr:LysM peptidoglycan-binding domain-containing protein [Verrucomicrobiota bacterium]MBI3867924.1 LysM peptidoglycan-binding domain-containing protein [Verrucomicrobiota bacterium]